MTQIVGISSSLKFYFYEKLIYVKYQGINLQTLNLKCRGQAWRSMLLIPALIRHSRQISMTSMPAALLKKINLKILSTKKRKIKQCTDKEKVIYCPFCLSMMHTKDVERTGRLYLFMYVYECVCVFMNLYWAHKWHGAHVVVKRQIRMLVFAFHLVWGSVSLLLTIIRAKYSGIFLFLHFP